MHFICIYLLYLFSVHMHFLHGLKPNTKAMSHLPRGIIIRPVDTSCPPPMNNNILSLCSIPPRRLHRSLWREHLNFSKGTISLSGAAAPPQKENSGGKIERRDESSSLQGVSILLSGASHYPTKELHHPPVAMRHLTGKSLNPLNKSHLG